MTKKSGRTKTPIQRPKLLRESFSLNSSTFKWSFENCLWEHKGWEDCKSLRQFSENILSKLQNLESQTWQEILNSSGGKSEGHGNNNHFITGDNLPKEEKFDFIKRGYMAKYEKVFSLRLSAKERLIGFVDLNVFNILWYDAKHKFF